MSNMPATPGTAGGYTTPGRYRRRGGYEVTQRSRVGVALFGRSFIGVRRFLVCRDERGKMRRLLSGLANHPRPSRVHWREAMPIRWFAIALFVALLAPLAGSPVRAAEPAP